MKTINNIEAIRDVVADYLTIRKAYNTYEEALEAVYNYPNEVLDLLAELDMFGDSYATTIATSYMTIC